MSKLKNKKWWAEAGIRAIKTTCQTLAGTLPAGFVITPVMVQNANWTMIYVAIAWASTGLFAGLGSILTSIASVPETKEG